MPDGHQQDCARAAPAVGHRSADWVTLGDLWIESAPSDLGQLTGIGQLTVEQASIGAARDPDHPDAGAIQSGDDHLAVQSPLQLVRQAQTYATDRLQRCSLGLRLSQRDEI